MRLVYFFAFNLMAGIILGLGWLLFQNKDTTAYIYPHEEARELFDYFHEEGYEKITSVTYIEDAKFYYENRYPSRIRGIIDGEVYGTHDDGDFISDMRKAFKVMPMHCPKDLKAKRDQAGWVYETDSDIRQVYKRNQIESCIGFSIATVYEAKIKSEDHEEEVAKWKRERVNSWEDAPRPE